MRPSVRDDVLTLLRVAERAGVAEVEMARLRSWDRRAWSYLVDCLFDHVPGGSRHPAWKGVVFRDVTHEEVEAAWHLRHLFHFVTGTGFAALMRYDEEGIA